MISNAASKVNNVRGLVYVCGFSTEDGEVLAQAEAGSKDSILNSALLPRKFTASDGGQATEFLVDPAKFHEVFAGDPPARAAVLAAGQRPAAERAFAEPNGLPAWKNLPSWAVVATGDKAAGADVIRSMAVRAGATITEVEGSHLIMISQAQAVTDVILKAVAALS